MTWRTRKRGAEILLNDLADIVNAALRPKTKAHGVSVLCKGGARILLSDLANIDAALLWPKSRAHSEVIMHHAALPPHSTG